MLAAVAALAMTLGPTASSAWAAASPGRIPPPCNAAFQFPGPGLYPSGGCIVTVTGGGITISPKVLHVGQPITATLKPPPPSENATWDWGNFVATVGFGSKHISGCKPQDTSCTVQASKEAVSNVWEVYELGVNLNPVGCCGGLQVSGDYFIVNNNLHQLSGRVELSGGTPGSQKPEAGVRV